MNKAGYTFEFDRHVYEIEIVLTRIIIMDTVQSIIMQYYMVNYKGFTTKEKLISEEFVLRCVAVLYFSRLYGPCGVLTSRVRD